MSAQFAKQTQRCVEHAMHYDRILGDPPAAAHDQRRPMINSSDFARRLREILTPLEEQALEVRARKASLAMWQQVYVQQVAQYGPFTVSAALERWSADLAEMPLSERLRAGRDKLVVLRSLGFGNAGRLVLDAMRQADEQAARRDEQADQSAERRCRRVR